MQPRLHRSDFGANRSRDFGERQLLVFSKDHDLALQRRQQANCASDELANLQLLDTHRHRHELFLVDRVPALLVAPALEHQVPRDAKEEAAQRPPGRIEPIVAEERQEHVLRDVVSDRGRRGHPPGEPVDRIFVFLKRGLESGIGHGFSTDYQTAGRRIRPV